MPTPSPASAERRIRWQPWASAAFRRSAEERRPVLLFMTTSWSAGSAAMLHTSYEDPSVATCVERSYVPVHVDAELRPDVAERYALDGWPATLLLTSDGEILHGVHYLEAEPLCELLERTAAMCREQPEEITARAAAARQARRRALEAARWPDEAGPELAASIAAALLARADRRHGGFSEMPKRFDGDALRFLLRYGMSAGDREAVAHVQRTLDEIDASPLIRGDGAISRCATGPDWSEPSGECDLATQAAGLHLFAEASAALGPPRYGARTRALAAHVRSVWLASFPDAADVSAAIPSRRLSRGDSGGGILSAGSLPTDLTAELATACFAAAISLEDPRIAQEALSALERCVLATYRPGWGVAHSEVSGAPRLLSDHVHAIQALLDAHQITGEPPYAMMAEELGWYAVSAFADPETDALRDRVHADDDAGRLVEPWHPFRANALGAGAWARLAAASGEQRFAEAASRTLAWASARWRQQGPEASLLGLVALDLID
jgi:uncharacterized protein